MVPKFQLCNFLDPLMLKLGRFGYRHYRHWYFVHYFCFLFCDKRKEKRWFPQKLSCRLQPKLFQEELLKMMNYLMVDYKICTKANFGCYWGHCNFDNKKMCMYWNSEYLGQLRNSPHSNRRSLTSIMKIGNLHKHRISSNNNFCLKHKIFIERNCLHSRNLHFLWEKQIKKLKP